MASKSPAKLKREIDEYLGQPTGGLFFPGGSGGGGSTRSRPGSAVVKPHARTSPRCDKCTRYHTTEEHDLHGDPIPGSTTIPKKRTAAKKKATAKKKPSAKKKTTTKKKKPAAKKKKATAKKKPAAKKKTTAKKKTAANKRPKKIAAKLTASEDKAPAGETESERKVRLVTTAVKNVPASGRYGKVKVFISAIYDRVGKKIGMTMPQFKQWLIQNNQMRNIDLARADLIGAMDPKLVSESEINDKGATFHFVIDRSVKEAY